MNDYYSYFLENSVFITPAFSMSGIVSVGLCVRLKPLCLEILSVVFLEFCHNDTQSELKQSGQNKQNFMNNSVFFPKMGEMGPKLANMVFFAYFERFCHYFFCLISLKMKNHFILSQRRLRICQNSGSQVMDRNALSQSDV